MMQEQASVNRCKHEITHQILEILATVGPCAKTEVMYKAALSYEQVNRYLGVLEANGLIAKNTENRYIVTAEGLQRIPVLKEACA